MGAITALIGLLQGSLGASNLSVLYLLAVLGEAIAFGRGPAITTCAASFLAFNWFFVEPLHTLTVARPEEWAALLVFLAVAAIASELAAGQRLRAQEAEQREREAEVLYDVVRLMSEPDLDTALRAVAERLLGALDLAAVGIEIPEAGDASHWVAAGDPTATQALRSSGALPPERVRAIPVKAADRLGKVVLLSKPDGPRLLPADERLLSAVATQIGLAMERRRLRREANEAEILRRADDLKTSLLNAVSHDLRTPLSSIIASAGSLLQKDVAWSGQERREFARAIDEEARRLNRIVTNLLNLSRINSGNLQPDRGWYDLGALVEEVLGRLRPVTARHRVSTYVQEDLPPVLLDYVEIDQVL
ncbi:MAG TPA: DUF4118 domain-containing protein, partial [Chloroflexota bacterium]